MYVHIGSYAYRKNVHNNVYMYIYVLVLSVYLDVFGRHATQKIRFRSDVCVCVCVCVYIIYIHICIYIYI